MSRIAQLKKQIQERAKTVKTMRETFDARSHTWEEGEEAKFNAECDLLEAEQTELASLEAIARVHSRAEAAREVEERQNHQPNARTERRPEHPDEEARAGAAWVPSEEEKTDFLNAWARAAMGLGRHTNNAQRRALKRVLSNPRTRQRASRDELQFNMFASGHFRRAQAAWRNKRNAEEFYESRALSALVAAQGGTLMLPTEFLNRITVAVLTHGPMFALAEVINTGTGAPLQIPTADDTGNEGAMIGENTAITDQDPVTGAQILGAYKFTSLIVKVPQEAMEDDGYDMTGLLGDMLGERIGRRGNRAMTVGLGSGPKPIVDDAGLGKTAASATTVTGDELIDLQESLDSAWDPGAAWMFKQSTKAIVRKLKASGTGEYLWQPAIMQGTPELLNGKPYNVNNHMAAAVSGARSILYGDFSKYILRLIGEMRLLKLTERYADTDQTGFVALQRLDGLLSKAGSQPPVVALAQA